MNRVLILMPYFGEFPIWMDLYLYSCSKNTFIDFLIITDNYGFVPKEKYKNVKFKYISFSDYCKQISLKLNIKFAPNSAYKLCDVRPFFGVVHEQIIKDYDFWGFGDLDVVYGDLRLILTEDRLKKYNLISSHADRIAGHFTVVRKDSHYSRLCYDIPNWKIRLQDEFVYGMDEHDFTFLVFPIQQWIWRIYRVLKLNRRIVYYRFFSIFNFWGNIFTKHHFKEYLTSVLPQDGEVWRYDIKEGRMFNPYNVELPYLHFLFFKKTKFYKAEHFWKEDFWHVRIDRNQHNKQSIYFTNVEVYD
ncbi:MAG: DUF6625 family protein [Candidatus Cryptobacteroides sp.]